MNMCRLEKYFNVGIHKIYQFILLIATAFSAHAQYPQYFTYDDENGLPSNEVYSIIQDERGFIWFGCDAGLYKFDGVRYIGYHCATQKSKSLTGLTLSPSGKLYCYNFHGQLFVLENDTLKDLNRQFTNITGMVSDKSGNIFICYSGGVASYNEIENTWIIPDSHDGEIVQKTNRYVAKAARVNEVNELYFINADGVSQIKNGNLKFFKNDYFSNVSSAKFLLEYRQNILWIFSMENSLVYKFKEGRISVANHQNLNKVIQNRKLTNVKLLPDGMLWICSYSGIIKYNPETDEAQLMYPGLSFSDCIIDREGNYWFTTLQSGLMRVPDLNYLVWNKGNELLKNDKLTKIISDGTNVYFSTVDGTIGSLNSFTNELNTFHTDINADVQSLDYDFTQQSLLFNINNILFSLKGDKVAKTENDISAIKSICRVGDEMFFASSSGTFLRTGNESLRIDNSWSRELRFDSLNKTVWVASNDGLIQLKSQSGKWHKMNTCFKGRQILSLDFDDEKRIVALAFDGKIETISDNGDAKIIALLPEDVQAYKLKFSNKQVVVATNKGIWIYDLIHDKWKTLNVLSGLASNNIQDLIVLDKTLWIATGKGLQKAPFSETKERSSALIYLKNLKTGNETKSNFSDLHINYGQSLFMYPEASNYSSNGNFEFAYRINNHDSRWNVFPATTEEIMVQNIPVGTFEIELKVIDHLGIDSGNSIVVSGYVHPPFWKSRWFYLLMAVVFVAVVFFINQTVISNVRKKAAVATELSNLKLTAIRAQMNPHFIFNALNSIQDLVLKGDVEHAYSYITTFSNLVRKTLNYSDKEWIDFDDELNLLELYLALEKLRFKKTLQIEIHNRDVEDIQIPPMLIQPFIENALVHGLLHREGEKKLKIDFQLKDNLICIIEDNGIGREQAKIIRQRQRVEHESFSGNATRKRFEILSESLKGDFGFQYQDLYENSKPTGTRVTLIIPVKQKF